MGKNTARGICSAWGNLVHFFSTFRLKTDKTSLFECFLTISLKYLVWSHFCNALKSTSHFPYPNMRWEGKLLVRVFWWNLFNFFSLFCLEPHKTSLFEWMLTMSLKYSVLKTDRLIFLPKRCCVFYPQIETLRLSVWTLKTLSRTKVGTEYCFLELCIWEEIFDCEMHSHLEVLIWPSGTD